MKMPCHDVSHNTSYMLKQIVLSRSTLWVENTSSLTATLVEYGMGNIWSYKFTFVFTLACANNGATDSQILHPLALPLFG